MGAPSPCRDTAERHPLSIDNWDLCEDSAQTKARKLIRITTPAFAAGEANTTITTGSSWTIARFIARGLKEAGLSAPYYGILAVVAGFAAYFFLSRAVIRWAARPELQRELARHDREEH